MNDIDRDDTLRGLGEARRLAGQAILNHGKIQQHIAAHEATIQRLTEDRDEARDAVQFYNRKAADAAVLRNSDREAHEATIARLQVEVERAFKGGYHCRWDRWDGVYRFNPAMSPGDPDGAYQAWLNEAPLVAQGEDATPEASHVHWCGTCYFTHDDRLDCVTAATQNKPTSA